MATCYIATTGSDAYTYAQAQNPATPWLTFAKFLSSSLASDTCIARAGTYTFSSATVSSRTLSAYSSGGVIESVIFDGAAGTVSWRLGGASINNITFQNASHTANPLFWNDSNVSAIVSITGCVFKNLTIANIDSSKAALLGADIGQTWNIVNCLFNDIVGDNSTRLFGVQYNSGAAPTFNIINCVLYFVTSGATKISTIWGNWGTTAVNNVKNTIMYNVTGSTINWGSNGVGASFSYSDFYLITSSPAGTGVITSDPLFVDAANNDFRLRQSSPCRDVGTMV